MPLPKSRRFLTLFSLPTSTSLHLRTIFDGTFKLVRDRGLDHAVERYKNLKPLLSLKTLIINEPSNSLPVSLIKRSLQLPFRPIEFVRKYPSVFQEFLPVASAATHPHVRLTPEALALDAEEKLIHQSDHFKQQAADKLLKLLMISRIHKIPLRLVDGLQWDLGLPPNYVETVVPEFPDYFRVADGFLELVCWSHELAVSVLKNRNVHELGFPLVFPVQFSNGFEMDKKYEKWLREWQKLPYVSPYENASHLSSASDESDRWVVGVLHEILHVFVGKKIEKDSLLEFGEWLGLRSRFKRALLQHPGIFYVSSKIGTYTIVLREGYKRGSLIEDHPIMNLRNQYVHLMNSVKEESKVGKMAQGKGGVGSEVKGIEGGEGEGESDVESGEECDEEACDVEDVSETDVDEDEKRPQRDSPKIATGRRGRDFGKVKLDVGMPSRYSRRERLPLRDSQRGRLPLRDSQKERLPLRDSQRERLPLRDSQRERLPLRDSQRGRPLLRGSWREKSIGKTGEKNSLEFSRRRQVRGARKDVENAQQRSRSSISSGRSLASNKAPVL